MTIEQQDEDNEQEIDVTPTEARSAVKVNWQTRIFFISTIAAAAAMALFLIPHP